jgi:hypothetical protein
MSRLKTVTKASKSDILKVAFQNRSQERKDKNELEKKTC